MQKRRIKRMPVRSVFVDCDDTLIMWSSNKYYKSNEAIELHFMDYKVKVSPNDSNIAKVKEFYKKGYEIIVWSATGKEWAQLVVNTLKLVDHVDYCLSKPDFYIDDLEINQFTVPEQRIWNKPSGFED